MVCVVETEIANETDRNAPVYMEYFKELTTETTSNHLLMNHLNISSCQLCEIIKKDSSMGGSVQVVHDSLECLISKCIFLKVTVQETV